MINSTEEPMYKYVYSPSYPSVRLIQYFINNKDNVKVITCNPSIRNLCEYMDWDVIWFKSDTLMPVTKKNVLNIISWFNHYKLLKKAVSDVVETIEEGELYFTTLGIDIVGLHLIQKIARHKKSKIFYWPEVEHPSSLKNKFPTSIRELTELIKTNVLYSPIFTYKSEVSGKYIFVTEKYLSLNNITTWDGCEVWEKDVYEKMKIPNLEKNSIYLLLGGYSLTDDENIFGKKLGTIYNILKEELPDCQYKPHPGNYKIDGILKKFELFKYLDLPYEFIHQHLKVVICIASTGVSYLSNKNVKLISILDLLDLDNERKIEWKNQLIKMCNGNIEFPKTNGELKILLSDFREEVKC